MSSMLDFISPVSAISSLFGGNSTPSAASSPDYKTASDLLASRQNYQIPPELANAYNLSLNNANGESDIQQRMDNAANRQLAGQLSSNSRNATSGSEAQLGANSALQNYNQNLDQSAIAGSQQKQQNLSNYYNLSDAIGNQRQTAFEFNNQYPLEQRLAFLSSIMGNNANTNIANINANAALLGGVAKVASMAAMP